MFNIFIVFLISVFCTAGCTSAGGLLDATSLPGAAPSKQSLNPECFKTGGVCAPPSFSSAADGVVPRP